MQMPWHHVKSLALSSGELSGAPRPTHSQFLREHLFQPVTWLKAQLGTVAVGLLRQDLGSEGSEQRKGPAC